MYCAANWQIAYTKIGVPKKCYILRYLSYLNPFLPNPEVIFPFSLFPGRSVLCCQKQNKVRKEQNIIPFTKMTKSALEKNDKIPSREPWKVIVMIVVVFVVLILRGFSFIAFFIHCRFSAFVGFLVESLFYSRRYSSEETIFVVRIFFILRPLCGSDESMKPL